ncbi:MAG: type IX secretion system membrane protein PorP/SprF [Bacteroidales bacterium]|nr:type IX secretion system membrane protein PorP/SprF [Bacteroidales bacterium]MCF8332832.1 type IX secretion system membrane protein PorP/SprF [Bacteroidales bacterium]
MKEYLNWIPALLFFFTAGMQAQDVSFSQFYSSPLQLNPALAGQLEQCARIGLNYRNQWPAIPDAYQTYQVTYDQTLSSINSGFGLLVNSDRQGSNAYVVNQAGGIFSHQIKATEKIVVSAGMQATYYQNSLNTEELVFADQINIGGTDEPSPTGIIANETQSFVDFSGGLAFDYDNKYYGGLAVHHMTEPSNSFTENDENYLSMKYTIHGGAMYKIEPAIYEKKTKVISPNFLYVQQGKYHQLNLGLYAHIKPFIFGGWFRHNFENPDATIILLGLQLDNKWKVGYSYDYSLSALSGNTGGAHEISLSYRFCIYVEKSREVRAIKCPEF